VELPEPVAEVADELAASRGVVAVVVGGSRATGDERPESDWDLGVYYRGSLDLSAVAARGEVYPPGSWGRMMNGGAWLDVDGTRVDVLLRDLDVVEHWTAEAEAGRFEVDGLLGYVAGIPTYSLAAEAAVAVTVAARSRVPAPSGATGRCRALQWRYRRDFSLMYAERHAPRSHVAGTVGQAARRSSRRRTPVGAPSGVGCSTRSTWSQGVGLDEAADLLGRAGRRRRSHPLRRRAPGRPDVARRRREVIPSGDASRRRLDHTRTVQPGHRDGDGLGTPIHDEPARSSARTRRAGPSTQEELT
jgi:hypothetical protein